VALLVTAPTTESSRDSSRVSLVRLTEATSWEPESTLYQCSSLSSPYATRILSPQTPTVTVTGIGDDVTRTAAPVPSTINRRSGIIPRSFTTRRLRSTTSRSVESVRLPLPFALGPA
jgi:hypothetical protein